MPQPIDLSPAERDIYEPLANLPIVSPHGHTNPAWFARDAPFGDPASLLVTPDHYVFRMLYSRGVDLAELGIGGAPFEPRRAFARLAEHWDAFLGTPSRSWMEHALRQCFNVDQPLTPATAMDIYDQIDARLKDPAFRPRALLDRFGIEILATTDGALDDLQHHREFASTGHATRLIPTFRPDAVLNPARPGFAEGIVRLGECVGQDITDYDAYMDALRERRRQFIEAGATATDHDVPVLATRWLSCADVTALFDDARRGTIDANGAARFYGHVLIEMAQMSLDDGLVMQIHAGSRRSTNHALRDRFGADMGADIPQRTDWVGGLDALLNRVGNDASLTIIAFTLDETAYARELAPMAGHWPALRLGPPWWFHDSLNGILRYFDQVVETAGYRNLAGFNDDTRAFLSIPARHDLWRRAVAIHLARQVGRGLFDRRDAARLGQLLARDLAVEAYRLGSRA
ncbi:glucuronate isomerase [Jannaschia sp. S6380]|uniref:glucuronate isomerase n=1 Tax=Jannaschia sp. S6380 TaxID=2926408 RepID=UPI001FF4AC10|nr:glucuronate isomerase [Jannaschia sp. S6380]